MDNKHNKTPQTPHDQQPVDFFAFMMALYSKTLETIVLNKCDEIIKLEHTDDFVQDLKMTIYKQNYIIETAKGIIARQTRKIAQMTKQLADFNEIESRMSIVEDILEGGKTTYGPSFISWLGGNRDSSLHRVPPKLSELMEEFEQAVKEYENNQ